MMAVNLAFTSSSETLDASPMIARRRNNDDPNPSTDSGVNSETSFDLSSVVAISMVTLSRNESEVFPAAMGNGSVERGHLDNTPTDLPAPAFLPPLAQISDGPKKPAEGQKQAPWILPPLASPNANGEAPGSPACPAEVRFDTERPQTAASKKDPDLIAPRCRCLCCHPSCLRRFTHPVTFLVLLSMLVFVQSFVVIGYTSSITTTIERRYNIKTTWIGVIISTYDIACIFATFFVSYYANNMNRPRFLGGSALVLLVGLVVFSLPHFTGSSYKPLQTGSSTSLYMCNASSNAVLLKADKLKCDATSTEPWAVYIFILAQVIIGIGASPIYIIGPTYLYDILHPLQYPIYSAIMYVFGALGPALGFVLGSAFLSTYIDWPAQSDATLHVNHSQWLGAWWIGFLMAAGLGFFIALPLLSFPPGLPEWFKARRERGEKIGCLGVAENTAEAVGGESAAERREKRAATSNGSVREAAANSVVPSGERRGEKEQKEKNSVDKEKEEYKSMKNMPKAIARVFVNPVWLFITLLSIEEQFVVSAFVAFVSKYFQTMYGLPPYRASIVTGLVVIPSAVVGVVVGAVIVRQMKLNLMHASSFLVGLCAISTSLMVALMFMGCDSFKMAGLHRSYIGGAQPGLVNFSATCNAPCDCTQAMYSPVCDKATGTTYFSPCHAGCTGHTVSKASDTSVSNFSSCTCAATAKWLADGRCEMVCPNFIPSLIIIFLVILVTSFGQDPAHIITISSVSSADRSFGLGMQVLVIRAFAFVPAPIVFGYIFDSACILWKTTCFNTTGSCREYNLQLLPYVWIGVLIGLKALGVLFSVCLMISSKQRATVAISVVASEAEANKANASNQNQRVLDGALPTSGGERSGGEVSVTRVHIRRLSSASLSSPRFANPGVS